MLKIRSYYSAISLFWVKGSVRKYCQSVLRQISRCISSKTLANNSTRPNVSECNISVIKIIFFKCMYHRLIYNIDYINVVKKKTRTCKVYNYSLFLKKFLHFRSPPPSFTVTFLQIADMYQIYLYSTKDNSHFPNGEKKSLLWRAFWLSRCNCVEINTSSCRNYKKPTVETIKKLSLTQGVVTDSIGFC